ncbi:MAG: ABC transporter ATP-binding protein [Defluviitaleaceae bacterium]|nr:ABC transporter ATP-binding protein [Defluviitaleaceae bacterium]MCL2275918.1 ABC transporter ATP-binding protein [Defluviitaleaceae bacterium]
MSETILRTIGITKKYGTLNALDSVSIEIKRGQIYGLIGLNGAGKSTFMRSIMGLITPSAGNIELFGEGGEEGLRRGRRRIGQSIEYPVFYPDMSAHQNLELQRRLGGVPHRGVIEKVLKTVGLEGTGKKKAKDFSMGMKQRLVLAKALITNPEFLILDEPTNGLDPMGIIEMRELMRQLAKERGLTLLVSSHLLDELAQVATHYGIIHHGKLVAQLSAEELAAQSRQYVKITVDDPAAALTVLSQKMEITDYQVITAKELRVYEKTDKAAQMNALLVQEGLAVSGLYASEQKLEEYFMELTTGGAA